MEKRLSEMNYEETGVVKKIEPGLREQVAGVGVREGKEIKMMTKHPMKGPIVVTVGRASTSFGLALAQQIVVEVEE